MQGALPGELELSVVIPLFNEAENLPELHRRLTATLPTITAVYEIVLVDDGSTDATVRMLEELQMTDPHVTLVVLSRNFGHQAAITAGLQHARGRAVVVMDGDLQDPPEVLPEFVAAWRAGHEVVYAVRTARKENLLKRAGYFLFYRLWRAISDLDIPLDSGDFCLMDRRVVEVVNALPERSRFVRGLRTYVGFRQIGVAYERAGRAAGKPKYSFRALFRLATDGLVSFSSYPLQLATLFGFFSAFVGLLLAVWVVWDSIYQRMAPRGWASTMVVVLFMGSVQLICLGIMGQYVRRTFIESKQRPTYLVRRVAPARVLPSAPADGPSRDFSAG